MRDGLVLAWLYSLLLTLGVPGSACAADSRATDAAFAALLSLPGANAGWNIEPPEDMEGGDEKALISFLGRQLNKGADLNAYRHDGTLLLHANRAKKGMTARWLLEHGANPALTVKHSTSNAMGLALKSNQASLVKRLKDKYGMLAILPEPAASRHQRNYPPRPQETVEVEAKIREANKVPAALDAALASIPEPVLRRQQREIVTLLGVYTRAGWEQFGKKYDNRGRPDLWRVAWQRLPKPIDYSGMRGLASMQPYGICPELMASGYPANDTSFALECMINDVPIDLLQKLWPALLANFPTFKQDAPRLVLAHYLIEGRHPCWTETVDLKAKLALLASEGMRTPVNGLSGRKLALLEPDVLKMAAQYLPRQAAVARIVDAKAECTKALSAELFAALVGEEGNAVQAVAVPGESDCAYFISVPPQFEPLNSWDSFEGPQSPTAQRTGSAIAPSTFTGRF